MAVLTGEQVVALRAQLSAAAVQQIQTKNESESPLLRLPKELILIIGGFLFAAEPRQCVRGSRRQSSGVNLLQTCFGLRASLAPKLFVENVIIIEFEKDNSCIDLSPWLDAYPTAARKKMKQIRIEAGSCSYLRGEENHDYLWAPGVPERAAMAASMLEGTIFDSWPMPPVVYLQGLTCDEEHVLVNREEGMLNMDGDPI